MRQGLLKNKWSGRLVLAALAALTLALGLCLFDGSQLGMDGHHGMSPDYCAGLVTLTTILPTLLWLATIGCLLAEVARPVYAVSLVCLDPPPKSPSFS